MSGFSVPEPRARNYGVITYRERDKKKIECKRGATTKYIEAGCGEREKKRRDIEMKNRQLRRMPQNWRNIVCVPRRHLHFHNFSNLNSIFQELSFRFLK